MPDQHRPRVVVLGAAGQMMQVTARLLAQHLPAHELCLADINGQAVMALAHSLSRPQVSTAVIDVAQSSAVQRLIQRASLVVHGAGPFYRTAQGVREACLAAGVDCLDIDDDVESNQAALALHAQAQARGVRLLVGCGASPGVTNLLALDAMSYLDEVHQVEMAWCVGDEGPQQMGRAVADHAFHIGAGNSVAVVNGQLVVRESMTRHVRFPMGGLAGARCLFEIAHPEPVQFAHSHPHVANVVCWGGFDPAPLNGLLKGVSRARQQGWLSEDAAFDFLHELAAGRAGTWSGWRYALPGLWWQWRLGALTWADALTLGRQAWTRGTGPCRNGLAVRVSGVKHGHPMTVVRQAVRGDGALAVSSMAQATGTAAAVFACLALTSPSHCVGTLFPQMWVQPTPFFAQLRRFGLNDVMVGAQTIKPGGCAPGKACPR